MIAAPSTSREATLTGAPQGLVGTLAFKVIDPPSGTVILTESAAGITEVATGVYSRTFTTPAESGQYLIVWTNGPTIVTEELEVTWSAPAGSVAAPAGHYASPADLRAALGLAEGDLSDAQALRLLQDSEDIIDRLLGAYYPDETTGRKIVQADVEPWQWGKLARAAVALAALLHANPGLIHEQRWDRVSGPDFSFAGQNGAAVGAQVLALLDDSGLRRLAGRATVGDGRPMRPEYDRFLKATRHSGT